MDYCNTMGQQQIETDHAEVDVTATRPKQMYIQHETPSVLSLFESDEADEDDDDDESRIDEEGEQRLTTVTTDNNGEQVLAVPHQINRSLAWSQDDEQDEERGPTEANYVDLLSDIFASQLSPIAIAATCVEDKTDKGNSNNTSHDEGEHDVDKKEDENRDDKARVTHIHWEEKLNSPERLDAALFDRQTRDDHVGSLKDIPRM